MHASSLFIAVAVVALNTCCTAADPPLLKSRESLNIEGGNVAAADVNGDKRPDLLVRGSQQLHVMLGQADTFKPAPGSPVALAQGASEMGVGDVNRDGKADVLVSYHDTYDISVLLGAGDGTFAPAEGSPFKTKNTGKAHTHGLVLGEFNEDGKIDVATANSNEGDLSLSLGDGTGRFKPVDRSFPCGPSPYPIAAADVDGDGHLDVLVPNSQPGVRMMSVLRGDGRGAFAPPQTVSLAGGAFFVTTGDLNADGKPDAFITHHDEADDASILLNDGRGGFAPAPASPLELGHNCWAAAIVDMNRDGKTDVVTAGGGHVRVFLADGRGALTPAPGSPFATGAGTWRMAVADFDVDGKLDVAATCLEAGRVAVLMGQ